MRLLHSVLVVALSAAVPAIAAPSADSGKDDGEKMVCKNQAKTGTRFATRICRTKAHWELMREQARRQAEEEFNKRMIDDRRGN